MFRVMEFCLHEKLLGVTDPALRVISESREMQCSEQGSRRHRSSGSQGWELGSWQPAQVPAAEGLQLQLAWRNLSRTQQKVEKGEPQGCLPLCGEHWVPS